MKIYISGKISGMDIEAAKGKFLVSETILWQKGFYPINPFNLSPVDLNKTWIDYMTDDIRGLLDCEAIYMQKDWGQSKGARLEYAISKELGLKIYFEGEL